MGSKKFTAYLFYTKHVLFKLCNTKYTAEICHTQSSVKNANHKMSSKKFPEKIYDRCAEQSVWQKMH